MVLDAGSRFLVARNDLHAVRITPDPDAPAARALADGEVRLAVEQFGFSANNISYATFGEAMKYWQLFPAEDGAWGCIPAWGFATAVESRAATVEAGTRVYGCLPMGSHLVVQPVRADAGAFVDASAHRQGFAAFYNRFTRCDADPFYRAEEEAEQALLRPLFTTAFLIADFLADNDFFGARQMLMSSASSKTAWATAFCLSRCSGAPAVVGVASALHHGSASALGCYAAVSTYGELAALDACLPTVYVDFAGDAALRRAVHERFGARLAHSCAVGATHRRELGGADGLPGPRPRFFFAPAQFERRNASPPGGWGSDALRERIADAWRAFIGRVAAPAAPWLRVRQARGAGAVEAAYRQALDGSGDARDGFVLRL